MKIDITPIVGVKGASLEFDLEEQRLPLVFPFAVSGYTRPVRAFGKVTNTGKYLLVQGQISTTLAVSCDRCLEPFEYPLELEFEAEFRKQIQTEREDSDQDKLDEDDGFYSYQGTIIDLVKTVEDELAVGAPVKMLCHQECKGLCPTCGKNLNEGQCDCVHDEVDPRFEALRSLLEKKD